MRLLGLPIDGISMDETVAQIRHRACGSASRTEQLAGCEDVRADQEWSPAARRAAHIITLNPEMVMAARRNLAFTEVIRRAELVVADGVGITLAARLAGVSLRGRVPGADLLPRVAKDASGAGFSLFLLGAAPGVAERAAAALRASAPGLRVATFCGTRTPCGDRAALRAIEEAAPDVLFVAFGVPAQELWIARNAASLGALGVAVAVGVGGAFDVLAGAVPRAPAWMRRIGCEWIFRLLMQPWRARRMLVLPVFGLLAMRAAFAARVVGSKASMKRKTMLARELGS